MRRAMPGRGTHVCSIGIIKTQQVTALACTHPRLCDSHQRHGAFQCESLELDNARCRSLAWRLAIATNFHTVLVFVTPVAGLIFETKNRAIFLERIFGRGITAREQVSRAVILEKF